MIIYNKKDIPKNLQEFFEPAELGLEPDFNDYINKLCDIFDEVKRVLRKDGTCWVNLGDTYYGSGTGHKSTGKSGYSPKTMAVGNKKRPTLNKQLKSKCLVGIPNRFVIEMMNRGWILRNTIIWHKPNCMPTSVKDRFTVDFEYVFFFVKSKKYCFEQQFEPLAESTLKDKRYEKAKRGEYVGGTSIKDYSKSGFKVQNAQSVRESTHHSDLSKGRNKRTVWKITTKGFKGAHFATYNRDLISPMIKAGCPEFVCNKCGKPRVKIIERKGKSSSELMKGKNKSRFSSEQGQKQNMRAPSEAFNRDIIFKGYSDCGCNAGFKGGVVLDPFMGSGTVAIEALSQNKKYLGIELNPEYVKIINSRINKFTKQDKLI